MNIFAHYFIAETSGKISRALNLEILDVNALTGSSKGNLIKQLSQTSNFEKELLLAGDFESVII